MGVTLKCPECGAKLSVPDKVSGKGIICPLCATRLRVADIGRDDSRPRVGVIIKNIIKNAALPSIGIAGAVITAALLTFFWLSGGEGKKTANEERSLPAAAQPIVEKHFVNSGGTKMVRIPAGTFTMGSPAHEKHHVKNEEQHEVEVSEFYLGATEVTQQQFRAVMGYNPSYFSNNAKGKAGVNYGGSTPGGGKEMVKDENTEEFPVENVSWDEADEFCRKLTALDKKKPTGWVYRLPREAEWEYASRGAAPSYQTFHFGNSLSAIQANFNGTDPYGGARKAVNLQRTCKVGSYRGNTFGLLDMHGNTTEWCADWFGEDYYRASPGKNPPGPVSGSYRLIRGGCWRNSGHSCRSAVRGTWTPMDRTDGIGFRPALVPLERAAVSQ
jgi:formylglycine-generating enzyme required for sulfatase activity